MFNCRKLSMRILTPSATKRHCQVFLKRYVQLWGRFFAFNVVYLIVKFSKSVTQLFALASNTQRCVTSFEIFSFYLKAVPLSRSTSSIIPVKASTSGVQAQSSSSSVDSTQSTCDVQAHSSSSRLDSTPAHATDNRLRIISWNIDGLDTNNINTRTKAACETILRLLAISCPFLRSRSKAWAFRLHSVLAATW